MTDCYRENVTSKQNQISKCERRVLPTGYDGQQLHLVSTLEREFFLLKYKRYVDTFLA